MAQNKSVSRGPNGLSAYRDISVIISLVFALEVMTFQHFFILSPYEAGSFLIALQRVLFGVGWVSFIAVTPLTLILNLDPKLRSRLFLASWVVWPATLVFIHTSSLITDQNPYLDYLFTYPIFIFTDVIAPVIYALVWIRNRNTPSR